MSATARRDALEQDSPTLQQPYPTQRVRWELPRALGAVILTPPPTNGQLCDALGLPTQSGVDYTDTFILTLPPHAAIYLGSEGKLGGEGLDRVSGFWRALGLSAPNDADHLGALLMLYAELGTAEYDANSERVRDRLRTARTALFDEHIWSWAPVYLAAVMRSGSPATINWAQLTASLLRNERQTLGPCTRLPLALRVAPDGLPTSAVVDDALDALVAPVRSGFVVTQQDLQRCAATTRLGYRRGERRFATKAMLEQAPAETLACFADHARTWSQIHAAWRHGVADAVNAWWSRRAAASAGALECLAGSGRAETES